MLKKSSFVERADIGRLLAFRAGRHVEGDFLVLPERFETPCLNGREMCEQIIASIIRFDETETLRFVKPLDGASNHYWYFLN